jgi:hypothetical protein
MSTYLSLVSRRRSRCESASQRLGKRPRTIDATADVGLNVRVTALEGFG